MKFAALGPVFLLVPGGLCAGGNTNGLVSMMPASLPSPAYGANVTQPPVLPDGNAASMAPVPLFGIFAELPFTPGSVLACGVAAALAWSCRHRCRSAYEATVERGRDKKRRGDYSAVSASERDGLLSTEAPEGVATFAGGSDSGDDGGWSGLEGTPIVLAPLRLLGEAIKERLLSSSSRKGGRRRGEDDEETGDAALYDDPRSTEEEARGLLERPESRREDVEDLRSAMRPRSPVRSSPKRSSPKRVADSDDEDMDDDQDAVAALMKLRPAACDSLGHDEDDEAARPLIGSERAMFLSR